MSPPRDFTLNRFELIAFAVLALALGMTVASAATPDKLRSPAWDARHLGPEGWRKCQAFRRVRENAARLQANGNGTLTVSQRQALSEALATAKHMPPKSVTPFECGVPL